MTIHFRQARDFVYQHGLLWERALFAYLFQGGAVAPLHMALRCYKNADGGWGHAFEPDIRCPDSHPLALEFLLGMLAQTGVPVGDLFEGTGAWVEAQRNPDGSLRNPEAVRDYPRAPWWNEGGQDKPDSIVGLLHRFDAANPSLRESTQAWAKVNLTPEHIRANEWLFMCYHAYDYFSSILDVPNWEACWQATLDNIAACAEHAEPKQYYELFRFAPTPDAPVMHKLPAELFRRYLDHLEGAQDEDGGWHDEHGLPQWRAYTTILVLHGLRSHGREIGI